MNNLAIPLDISKFDNSIPLWIQKLLLTSLADYFPEYSIVIKNIAEWFE